MLMEKARKVEGVIVLPEGTEERILKAARIITKQKIAKIILLGNEDELLNKEDLFSLDLS
jgi:phosphotransacetylase